MQLRPSTPPTAPPLQSSPAAWAQVVAVDAQAGKMVPHQRVAIPDVAFPTQAAWDSAGRLWVVGGPPKETSSAIHVGVLAAKSEGGGGHTAALHFGQSADPVGGRIVLLHLPNVQVGHQRLRACMTMVCHPCVRVRVCVCVCVCVCTCFCILIMCCLSQLRIASAQPP